MENPKVSGLQDLKMELFLTNPRLVGSQPLVRDQTKGEAVSPFDLDEVPQRNLSVAQNGLWRQAEFGLLEAA